MTYVCMYVDAVAIELICTVHTGIECDVGVTFVNSSIANVAKSERYKIKSDTYFTFFS